MYHLPEGGDLFAGVRGISEVVFGRLRAGLHDSRETYWEERGGGGQGGEGRESGGGLGRNGGERGGGLGRKEVSSAGGGVDHKVDIDGFQVSSNSFSYLTALMERNAY